MADIRPFAAFRPRAGMGETIAALPYDVYNRAEAEAVVRENPDSFLAIDRAETFFGASEDMYSQRVYEKAAELLYGQIEKGSFIRETQPCYYLYEQTLDGRSQTGIVACASIDDYMHDVIKKHENTRADKEQDRIRHVDVCNMHTGPIFLAYRARPELSELIAVQKKGQPLYDFCSADGVKHRVWGIYDNETIVRMQSIFQDIDSLYIADGHHRCASAVKVGLARRAANPHYTGKEGFNYFLSVIFPDEELRIMDYNRVVRDLNGMSEETFCRRIAEDFELQRVGAAPVRPEKKTVFGMYLGGCWYRLTAKAHILSDDAVDGLDVSILQEHLLDPILGIKDPKTDKRIDFVGGIRGLEELERRVNTDMQVAFSLFPTSIGELFAVADAGRLMPPKSTWFEPKLRSGLFLHSLDEPVAGL